MHGNLHAYVSTVMRSDGKVYVSAPNVPLTIRHFFLHNIGKIKVTAIAKPDCLFVDSFIIKRASSQYQSSAYARNE